MLRDFVNTHYLGLASGLIGHNCGQDPLVLVGDLRDGFASEYIVDDLSGGNTGQLGVAGRDRLDHSLKSGTLLDALFHGYAGNDGLQHGWGGGLDYIGADDCDVAGFLVSDGGDLNIFLFVFRVDHDKVGLDVVLRTFYYS